MFPKYNSWEDLKETFDKEMVFECEGEIFLLTDTHVFHVGYTDEFITVDLANYPNGVIVSVVFSDACAQYLYRKVDFV